MLGLRSRTKTRETRATITLSDGSTFTTRDEVSFFGPNSTGLSASRARVESLTTVYRAIELLTGAQAMLEPQIIARATKNLITDNNIFRGDGLWTTYEMLDYEIRSRLTHGDSFAIKVGMTPRRPQPARITPIHPSRVRVYGVTNYRSQLIDRLYVVLPRRLAGTGRISGELNSFSEINNLLDQSDVAVLTPFEMFHVPGPGFNGITGMSPIEAAAQHFALEAAMEDSSMSFYGKGSLVSGIVRAKKHIKENEADAVKKRWQKKVSGVANAHEVVVLGDDMEFTPISVKPQEAQFVEMMRFNVEQTARVFGIPPVLLMEASNGNVWGSALEQLLTATEIFSLNKWLRPWEDRATMQLVPGTQRVQFDRSVLDRATTKDLAGAHAIYRKNGIMSGNEIRDEIRLPKVESSEMDDPMSPVPSGTPASEPGGNDGSQGGGDDADQGESLE